MERLKPEGREAIEDRGGAHWPGVSLVAHHHPMSYDRARTTDHYIEEVRAGRMEMADIRPRLEAEGVPDEEIEDRIPPGGQRGAERGAQTIIQHTPQKPAVQRPCPMRLWAVGHPGHLLQCLRPEGLHHRCLRPGDRRWHDGFGSLAEPKEGLGACPRGARERACGRHASAGGPYPPWRRVPTETRRGLQMTGPYVSPDRDRHPMPPQLNLRNPRHPARAGQVLRLNVPPHSVAARPPSPSRPQAARVGYPPLRVSGPGIAIRCRRN